MKYTLLTLLTIATLNVCGQNLVGISGGSGWTNISGSNVVNERTFRKGLNTGLTYDHFFTPNFSVGTGIIYNQRGYRTNIIFTDEIGNETGESATLTYNYDYITLPLKLTVQFGNSIYGFGSIGLSPSILVKAQYIEPRIEHNGNVIPAKTYDIQNSLNQFDIGAFVEIGGGYKFKGRYWLYTSFAYQHSISPFVNPEYNPASKLRHYGMTLNIGLKYNLTKV
jgi:hypothetical protein